MSSAPDRAGPSALIRRATTADVPAIRALAHAIWHAHYPGIITVAQIDYMLARSYSPEVLSAEIAGDRVEYYLLDADGAAAGYASIGPTDQPGEFKLHKIYLRPAWHGRGLGSRLLAHVESVARGHGAHTLILTVNKKNEKALAAYRRNGFAVRCAAVFDIGGGFVMDDFVLAKKL